MSRRLLAVLAALTMVLSVMGPVSASSGAAGSSDSTTFEPAAATVVSENPFKDASEGIFLIRLADAPIATYRGGIDGLRATSPRATGLDRVDARSADFQAYDAYLRQQQRDFVGQLEATIGRRVDIRHQYTAANNGLAVWLTPAEAAIAYKMPNVTFVQADVERELHTDAGPSWIGAPAIWGGPDCSGEGNCGEGMVIGVIDTGINPSNPSFADIGGDGYDHTNPKGQFFGSCDPANTSPSNPDAVPYDPAVAALCNDKLIGMWGYFSVTGSPIDYDGHGSHTASTAGGNFVFGVPVEGAGTSATFDISGVAPHANIISYAACCTLSALSAAIDQTVIDGVDAINYSIGSGAASDLWNDFDTVGYLNARDAGIFVATSAGNAGPGPETVGSPGDAPWLTTVAASSHDRSIQNTLINMSGGDTTPPADILGKGFTGALGATPIVYAGDFGFPLCDPGAFPAGTFSGEIVVCDRGSFGRVAKSQSVADGGAGGYVLANNEPNGNTLNGDAFAVPGVHISYDNGVILKTWLASGTGHTAEVGGVSIDVDASHADAITAFSSRGANRAVDVIVPNVAAPGLDVIAAEGIGDEVVWGIISGTSMASPHVAGSGALLMQAHPDWTPAEVQSALMTTAHQSVVTETGAAADPFDTGSGRVDLAAATAAGLVMDESTADYLAADPATGGDPKAINTPSVANGSCVGTCSWTRTVKGTQAGDWAVTTSGDAGLSLTVTPNAFSLAAGEEIDLLIEADVSAADVGVWLFGQIDLTEVDGAAPAAHLPAAVQSTRGDLPGDIHIWTAADAGSQLVAGLTSIEITDFTAETFGLVEGLMTEFSQSQDPTNGDPYDNLNDGTADYINVDVPEGTLQLIAETVASEAPDIDLFVGPGDVPSAATEACSSTSPTASEQCVIDNPDAGTWWVLVQNWNGSADQPDLTTLVTAVLPAEDAGNMTVEGPTSVGALEPFDITVFWDEPALEAGDHWYGMITIGTNPGDPGNVGAIPVRLVRHEDDVVKTVSSDTAINGDTLTFEITINPNVTPEDLEYWITDTIPEGMTYVEGSATNGAVVEDGVLTWHGVSPSPAQATGEYIVTTSLTDETCTTPFGDYIDLEAFSIGIDPGVAGDTVAFEAFGGGNPINFYGANYGTVGFTDDGYLIFDVGANYGGAPWVPQTLPDADLPNNVAALLWFDGEIFPDAVANHGVSLATAGDDILVVEWDDIQPFGGGDSVIDMGAYMTRSVNDDPGAYEIVMMYQNLGALPALATIGAEDTTGTLASPFLNVGDPSSVLSENLAICYDWEGPTFDPIVISYQVEVGLFAPSGTYTNAAVHTTDNPGSAEDTASASVEVTELNAAELKAEAAAVFADIAANTENDSVALWAGIAHDAIVGSLDPSLWDGGDRLTRAGSRVFGLEKLAARMASLIDRLGGPDEAAALHATDLLLRADERLALVAIDDAIAAGADQGAIDGALLWLDLARESADSGNLARAVGHYGRAWSLAFNAPPGDGGPAT